MVEPTQEFGYRDLGIVQDFRRQFLEPGFTRKTNDLAIAFQFYTARRSAGTNAVPSTELDRIFTQVVSGKLDAATAALDQLKKNSK